MRNRRIAVLVAGLAAALLTSGVGQANAAAPQPRAPESQWPAVAARAVEAGGSGLVALSPERVLDTRTGNGTGGSVSPIGHGQEITLDLSAKVPVGTSAVVLNLTGTEPTSGTHLILYPSGIDRPGVSNLNLVPGQTRPSATTVLLTGDRKVKIYNNAGSVHVIADLGGYYIPDSGSKFTMLTPSRLMDTRNSGGPVGGGSSTTVDFSFLPTTTTAVTFNLTGIGGGNNTFVTAYPDGGVLPVASNLNLSPNEVAPNQVTVRLGSNRKVRLFNNAGNTHLIVDLAGYYATDQGKSFYPVVPVRIADTRDDPEGPLTPEFFYVIQMPTDVLGVVVNVTATEPSAAGHVTVWQGGQAQPSTSNLNLVPGQTANNLVSVGTGLQDMGGGDPAIWGFNLANSSGSIHIIIDVAGVFAD